MKYILIGWMLIANGYHSNVPVGGEYNDYKSCVNAGEQMKQINAVFRSGYICTPKGLDKEIIEIDGTVYPHK